METFESRYFRGQGALFIGDRDAAGNPVGLTFVGDLTTATLTPQIERDEVIENVTGSGGVGASWLRASQFQVALTMRSIRPAHFAAALQGTLTEKAAGDVSDEEHVAKIGKFSRLQHTNVTNVVVTEDTEDTPATYVAGVDYKVHAAEGLIEWLSEAGATIADDIAVVIDYDYGAQYHVTAAPNNLSRYLVFAGKNSADDDKQTRCEMYRVKLDPGSMPMISESAGEMTINGVLETDSARPAGDQFFSWKVQV